MQGDAFQWVLARRSTRDQARLNPPAHRCEIITSSCVTICRTTWLSYACSMYCATVPGEAMRRRIDFTVDGFHYVWCVHPDNQVVFWIEESNYKTRMVPMEDLMIGWGDDDIIVSVGETGVCRTPVALIREVVRMTTDWIKGARPTYFWLQTPNPQKQRIYRKLINRYGQMLLKDFQIVEYEQAIYFYREIPQPVRGQSAHRI